MMRENRIVELAAWGFNESPDCDRVVAADDLAGMQERAANLIQLLLEWDSISSVLDDATGHLNYQPSIYASRNLRAMQRCSDGI